MAPPRGKHWQACLLIPKEQQDAVAKAFEGKMQLSKDEVLAVFHDLISGRYPNQAAMRQHVGALIDSTVAAEGQDPSAAISKDVCLDVLNQIQLADEDLLQFVSTEHSFRYIDNSGYGQNTIARKKITRRPPSREPPAKREVTVVVKEVCAGIGMGPDELRTALEQCFLAHDADGNGVLDQSEFVKCIQEMGSVLSIDRRVGSEIFRAVDANGDGMVEWREVHSAMLSHSNLAFYLVQFVEPAVRIIHANMAVAEEIEAAVQEAKREEAAAIVLNGMSTEQLEESLRTMFEAGDVDGSGKIEMKELRTVMSQMSCELSDSELNYLMFNLDTDGDGKLSLDEFMPMAFSLLVDCVVQMREMEEAAAVQEIEEEMVTQAMAEDVCNTVGISIEQLQQTLEEIFLQHDVDGNGVLDPSEFVRCMMELGSQLGLDKKAGGDIFRMVDANGDGVIEWQEFITPAVRVIHSSIQQELVEEAEEVQAAKREQARDIVLAGMSEEEMVGALKALFDSADADGSGKVDLKELRVVLGQMACHPSESELNYLMYNLDLDGDGKLSVDEFMPMAFELLVDCVVQMREMEEAAAVQEIEEEMVTQAMAEDVCDVVKISMEELQQTIEEIFLQHDADGNGVLDQSEFVKCMLELGTRLGIDRRAGSEIFRMVDVNGDGLVEYREFITPAVRIIYSSIGQALAEEMVADAQRKEEAVQVVLQGMSEEEFVAAAKALFEAADGDGSGKIDLRELRGVLAQMASDVSDSELNYLMYQLDLDQDGKLSIEEFIPMAFASLVDAVMSMKLTKDHTFSNTKEQIHRNIAKRSHVYTRE